MTLRDGSSAEKSDSFRWLVSEKSTAFGGAIRDMWSPTCLGDPGKVTDAEYVCDTGDSGGVHSNSGVPNHAYALLVDGGSFNGVNVTGIGLDKAANLWWYNQTHYLTPSSGFPEFADGLTESCDVLTGQAINQVSLQPDTPSEPAEPITADDCQQVANVITATQLRTEPTAVQLPAAVLPGQPRNLRGRHEAQRRVPRRLRGRAWAHGPRARDQVHRRDLLPVARRHRRTRP